MTKPEPNILLDDEQPDSSEIADDSSLEMLGLFSDILDYAKIQDGKVELEARDFDLVKLLEDSIAILATQAREKGIGLRCVAEPEVPALLRGDPKRLCQILTNLANNAIKFTDAGEVLIRHSLIEETDDGVLLRFSVRDTGIGIPARHSDLIFDKITRMDSSITPHHGGSGLGLEISRHLVKLMGGEIGVTSEEDKGSEFWFTARLGKQTVAPPSGPTGFQPPENRRSETLDGRKARVLVADDNRISRELALSMLRRMGLHADAATDGAEAVRILEIQSYDLVLMDVQMPVMDGLEAALRIRMPGSATGNQRVPIIAMTAHVSPTDREKFLTAEMNDCVDKPISPEALTRLLNKWLPNAGGNNGGGTEPAGNGAPRPFAVDAPNVSSVRPGGMDSASHLPEPEDDSAAAVFDRAGLARRLGDDASLIRRVSLAFFQDIPKQLDTLREALDARDGPRAHRLAHTICGASANIGGERLRNVAFKIEHAAAAGELDAAESHLPGLEAECEALRLAMAITPCTHPESMNQTDSKQP